MSQILKKLLGIKFGRPKKKKKKKQYKTYSFVRFKDT